MRRISVFLLIVLAFAARGFSANAAPVSISTIALNGSTVTVATAAAHGLVANQGFCLSAQTLCGVVGSVTNSTTFVFASGSAVACSSACGTVSPAPRIVILAAVVNGPDVQIQYVMWLTTVTPLQVTANSQWSGATAGQKNAIAIGNFIELLHTVSIPVYGVTESEIQSYMQNDYQTAQASLAATVQPATYYGDIYDGSGWTF